MSWAERLRALRMDLTPWRASRDFRLLLTAGAVFYFGAMVSYVAIPYQIFNEAREPEEEGQLTIDVIS